MQYMELIQCWLAFTQKTIIALFSLHTKVTKLTEKRLLDCCQAMLYLVSLLLELGQHRIQN